MRINELPSLSWRHRQDGLKTTQVDVRTQDLLSDDGCDLVLDALDVWLEVAQRNGFRAPGRRAPAQPWHIQSQLRFEEGIRFEFAGDALDYRAFQVLRNVWARLRLGGVLVVEMSVLCPDMWLPEDPEAPPIDEDNEALNYPPLHASAALLFNADNVTDSRFRRAVLFVRDPVGQTHVDALREVANRWFDLLEWGGFAMPVDLPWETECVGDAVAQFDECSMEVTVLRFRASEQAWPTLANMIFLGADALGLQPDRLVVDE